MIVRPAPPHLQAGVAALWELQGDVAGRSKGLPKPFVELVVSLSGRHLWQADEEASPIIFTDGWLTPVQTGPRYAQTIGHLHLVGARLHPTAAARLFGLGAAHCSTHPVPLDALLGSETRLLRQRLLDAPQPDKRFQVLATWLTNGLLEYTADWLPSVPQLGRLHWRVDQLARELGLSSRGLRKRFVQELGIGPKLWLQLARFDALLCHSPMPGELAGLAASLGYTDQAHLTAEFRRFAGLPPGAYIQSRKTAAAPVEAPHLVLSPA